MAYTDHYTNKISMEHTWAHRTTLGHRGHKMGSKRLVNLLQRKNPRLQRSGFIPSNYSRKRGPDGKAQASSQWTEADGEMPLTTSCQAGGGQSTSLTHGAASKTSQTVPRLYVLALFRDVQAGQVSWNSHACPTPNWQGSKVAWGKGLRFVKGQRVFRGMMYSVYIFRFCWNVSQYLRSLIARVFPCKQRQHWRACPDTGKDKCQGHALLWGGVCKHTHPVCSQQIAGSPQSPQCGMPAHLCRCPLDAMHVIPSHRRACPGLFLKSILCRFCNVKFQ